MAETLHQSAVDFRNLIERHLAEIFSSTDSEVRLRALNEIYTEDAVLFEPVGEVHGREAISETVGTLLAGLPPGFVFTASAPALGHHDTFVAPWRGGPPKNPSMLTGYDVVHFQDGRIKAVYVLIDEQP